MLRLPKSLHRLLAERAEAEGVSLNQLALTTLALGLGAAAPPAGRPPPEGARDRPAGGALAPPLAGAHPSP